MFNLNQKLEGGKPRPIAVKLPPGSSVDVVEVRWPTDAEWSERVRQYRIIHVVTGRSWRREGDNELAVTHELFKQVCLNGHADIIDDAEALYVIRRIERAECIAIERAGNEFTIKLRVASGITTHYLRAPRQRQIIDYKRAASPAAITRNGKTESRSRLEPAAQFYDELTVKPAEGYAAEIPIIHKEAILTALVAEIEKISQDEDEDPEE